MTLFKVKFKCLNVKPSMKALRKLIANAHAENILVYIIIFPVELPKLNQHLRY